MWGLAGGLGIQPMVFVSVDHDRWDEAEVLDRIAEVVRKRRPKPCEVDILGGNCEPAVTILANETHFDREKQPAIIKWLIKRLKAELEHGDLYDFEVVAHKPRA